MTFPPHKFKAMLNNLQQHANSRNFSLHESKRSALQETHFDGPKKGCDLKQKIMTFMIQLIALLGANQIARITSDFKMGVIN